MIIGRHLAAAISRFAFLMFPASPKRQNFGASALHSNVLRALLLSGMISLWSAGCYIMFVYAWSISFLCSYFLLRIPSRSYLRVWRRLTTTMPARCRKPCFADESQECSYSEFSGHSEIFQHCHEALRSIVRSSLFWPRVCSENWRYIFLHRTVDAFGLVQVELGTWKLCLIDLGWFMIWVARRIVCLNLNIDVVSI